MGGVDAGDEQGELEELSAVQRELGQLLFVHDGAQRGVVEVEQWSRLQYVDALGQALGGESQVQAEPLVDFDPDADLLGLKAPGLRGETILAGLQGGELEGAVLRLHRPSEAAVHILDPQRGLRDGEALFIQHHAAQRTGVALRRELAGAQERQRAR